MRLRKIFMILILPWLAVGPAMAQSRDSGATIRGSLTGQVTVRGQLTPEVHNVVISVEGIPQGLISKAKWQPLGNAQMEQKNETFVPHVLPVLVGSTVSFPNEDPILHNVFSDSPTHKFDLGLYPRGQSRSVKFDKPGVVEIRCNVHNTMSAFVVVEPTPYFAVPNERGVFQITELPPGNYTVKAWNPRFGALARPFSIESQGEVASVNFDFGSER